MIAVASAPLGYRRNYSELTIVSRYKVHPKFLIATAPQVLGIHYRKPSSVLTKKPLNIGTRRKTKPFTTKDHRPNVAKLLAAEALTFLLRLHGPISPVMSEFEFFLEFIYELVYRMVSNEVR